MELIRSKDRWRAGMIGGPVEPEDVDQVIESVQPPADPINPSHYRQGTLEVIDAIEGLALGYREGNCLKYLARYKYKNGLEDLRKARWYLERLIREVEDAADGRS